MEIVMMNKNARLSEHFTLGEMTKTSAKGLDNTPSHAAVMNLKNLCENWLENLRSRYGSPIVINSGYRSEAVNKAVGGVKGSNHLTGCAVDIRCAGKEQMIRYAAILLDIADGTKQEFDEMLLEQHGNVCWLHFAVRPKDNRRRVAFLKV